MTERRAPDPLLATIISDVTTLKEQMVENTTVTKEVREILTSFRIFASVCKWVAAVGAGIAAAWHGADQVRDLLNAK